jgi:hypothetical protein
LDLSWRSSDCKSTGSLVEPWKHLARAYLFNFCCLILQKMNAPVPNFPITEDQVFAIVIALAAYIIGTAIEAGKP